MRVILCQLNQNAMTDCSFDVLVCFFFHFFFSRHKQLKKICAFKEIKQTVNNDFRCYSHLKQPATNACLIQKSPN